MDLVRLKWQAEMEGKPVPAEEICRMQKEIEEVAHPKWEAWRTKYYTMSKEEQAQELTRSYPHMAKEME